MEREPQKVLFEDQDQNNNFTNCFQEEEEKERVKAEVILLLSEDEADEQYFVQQIEEISSPELSDSFYSNLLELFVHLSFDEEEARGHWHHIFAHYKQLCIKLDRDVGLRLSIFDYFLNLNKSLESPFLVEIKLFKDAEQYSVFDPLTNIFNRRYFDINLTKELRRTHRHSKDLSVLLLDLDNFKNINDTYGHLVGDEVLKNFALFLKKMSREEDLVCRYGGEEFVIILPETGTQGALQYANRLKEWMKKDQFLAQYQVTFSGGIASYPSGGTSAYQLVANADESLYKAKMAGKDQVQISKNEKRRAFRYPRKWQIFQQPGDEQPEWSKSTTGLTYDISISGVRIETDRNYSAGDKVLLKINPPDKEQIMVAGEIIWSRKNQGLPYSFGVKYIDLSSEKQEQLERILPSNNPVN